jgi:hypothetical protein
MLFHACCVKRHQRFKNSQWFRREFEGVFMPINGCNFSSFEMNMDMVFTWKYGAGLRSLDSSV